MAKATLIYTIAQSTHSNGSVSTVNSLSFNDGRNEVLVPTIDYSQSGNPRQLSDNEAIARYYQTGENLGKFNSVESANEYAQALHNQQALLYGNGFF